MKPTSPVFAIASPRFVRHGLLGLLGSSVLLMAGCSSTVKLDESATPPAIESRSVSGSGQASGAATSTVASVNAQADGSAAALAGLSNVVYFDFDSFIVKEEFRPVLDGHAKVLAGAPSKRLFVEGHTDERGGREYNLALGQKRAEAVVKSLTVLGVTGGQLEAVSYGEERSAAAGSNEEAWAKNRRVELKAR